MFAAVYYIDFAGGADTNPGTQISPWKHVKGMTGCTNSCNSATINGGDTVIFKGGVTWTGSFPWTIVGAASTDVTYTTDHSWFTGGAFTQPMFNRQGGGNMVLVSGVSHVSVIDLNIVNCGVSQTSNDTKCWDFTNGHDLSFTNNSWATETWIGLYIHSDAAGSYSNFVYSGNDCSHVSGCVWLANGVAGSTMHNATLNNNLVHDQHSQLGSGVHGDGLIHTYGVPSSDSSQYVDGLQVCNNKFSGDFTIYGGGGGVTAFLFFEGSASGTICNNDFSYTPAQAGMFQAEILFSGYVNAHASLIGMYNNSFAAIGTNAMSAPVDMTNIGSGSSFTYKNNIVYQPQYAIYVEDAGSQTALQTGGSNFNCWNSTGGFATPSQIGASFATWQGLGFDANSLNNCNPLWVSAPGNEHLNSGSPAQNLGTNLTSLCGTVAVLCLDRDGNARPSGVTPWDAGAYQLTPPPSLPTVDTTAATSVTSSTASSGGNVTSAGGGTVSARGVCLSTSANPTILDTCTSNGTGTGAFTSSLGTPTPLSAGMLYHIRAYATNAAGTAYGSDLTFTTSGGVGGASAGGILTLGGNFIGK